MSRDRVDPHFVPPTLGREPRPELLDARLAALRSARLQSRTWQAGPLRGWLWPTLGVSMVLLALVFWLRQPLADRFWPQTRAQQLRSQAAQALAQGRLSASDGTGARELYEAALAIDPDRSEGRGDLMKVAKAALEQARVAIAAERFADAHRALQLAQALSVPRARSDAVVELLRRREAAHAGIAQLLQRAVMARSEHRLTGSEDAALPLYARVLALQPDRIDALEGREDALADLLQQAQRALAARKIAQAAAMIATARGFDAGHADLPKLEAGLADALEGAHQQADALRQQGRLSEATDAYRALLAIDGNDVTARRGLEQVGVAWAQRADRLAADFSFADANAALAQARNLAPQAAVTAARHLQRARQAQAQLGSTLPVATRQRRVRDLLAAAAEAQARGDLLTPPGDSAFDKLRAARALAPDDAAVMRAISRLLPSARSCFEQSLRGNNLSRAGGCLDARQVLGDDDHSLARARRRLAERWLGFGDERLGAGELLRARAALDAARALDSTVPGLAAFAERVRTASASAQ